MPTPTEPLPAVLIVLVVLMRVAGWCPPVAARVITRFFMFFASLAAVALIYGEPVLKFTTRGWCLWAATVLTAINLFTIIGPNPGPCDG